MYLNNISISGYKNFEEKFEIKFNKGLNVLVGENGVGKSSIIDAIRLVLNEDEYGRYGISETDFNWPFKKDAKRSENIEIIANFNELTDPESIAFLPWIYGEKEARLTYSTDNKENNRGRYSPKRWGGVSQNSIFERESLDEINCIYLPPLRDAEAKLREGRGSRLARLIKNLNKAEIEKAKNEGKKHPLEEEVKEFYDQLAENDAKTISKANKQIKKSLKEAIGETFGQDTKIQFSETDFYRIVENLRLYFYPHITDDQNLDFRNLRENSLGYNNLIYIATVLAELTIKEEPDFFKILLIEEPEAHLHPQLQIKLLKYLEKTTQNSNIQIIVTTHSPVLASAISLDSIIHLSIESENKITSVPIHQCGLSDSSRSFLTRWLDVTKSTLLFAKGIILVEGIAEAMVIPELAKRVIKDYNKINSTKIPDTLEEQGISVINMNGIYFKHFMQLFSNLDPADKESLSIPLRCVGITDNDPKTDSKPTRDNVDEPENEGTNHALDLIEIVEKSINCRLYSNLKTFEYDLAMEGRNLNPMIDIFLKILPTNGEIRNEWEGNAEINWFEKNDDEKATIAYGLLGRIDTSNICGKGIFSQNLADYLQNPSYDFEIPEYIQKSILWVCKGE
jgi:predicted ATP-dependent endonuclease of OLD family